MVLNKDVTIERKKSIAGGDANDTYEVLLSNGEVAFLKENRVQNADYFIKEEHGIEAIQSTGVIRTPKIYDRGIETGHSYLLMEFIARGTPSPGYWEQLGCRLAAMHKAPVSSLSDGKYGFYEDNYIGAGEQINLKMDKWIAFFRENRLRPQLIIASRYFDKDIIDKSEFVLGNLDKVLIEPDQPSLLHGDLWSGNVMPDSEGGPVLIDPAVYVGCSEADIAMTELFGGFDTRFYEAYFSEMKMISGYESRRDIYNLYHLLNHLNLFGRGYLSSVISIIQRYAKRLGI